MNTAIQPTAAPFSPAEERRIVEQCIRFIQKRIRHHQFQFAMEVGERLFVKLFKKDRSLFRSGNWHRPTVNRIATDPRVNIPASKLYACLHTYLLAIDHNLAEPDLPVPQLSIWKWNQLYTPLEGRPEDVVLVAAWIDQYQVPQRTIEALAGIITPYLEHGGKLTDLLHGDVTDDDPYYARVKRILSLSEKKAREGIADDLLARAIQAVDQLLADL